MTEFQEVMRQWVRVRKATASNADEENVLSVYPRNCCGRDIVCGHEEEKKDV